MKTVFIIGKRIGESWELQGIYPTKQKAHSDMKVGYFCVELPFGTLYPEETMKTNFWQMEQNGEINYYDGEGIPIKDK